MCANGNALNEVVAYEISIKQPKMFHTVLALLRQMNSFVPTNLDIIKQLRRYILLPPAIVMYGRI
jgi:hypothetical protein